MTVYEGTERWYHVDTTHGSYNAMKSQSATRHALKAPGTVLSVYLNNAAAGVPGFTGAKEALVKVAGAAGWSPGWENAPFVLRTFTPEDHADAQVMVRSPDWERPET